MKKSEPKRKPIFANGFPMDFGIAFVKTAEYEETLRLIRPFEIIKGFGTGCLRMKNGNEFSFGIVGRGFTVAYDKEYPEDLFKEIAEANESIVFSVYWYDIKKAGEFSYQGKLKNVSAIATREFDCTSWFINKADNRLYNEIRDTTDILRKEEADSNDLCTAIRKINDEYGFTDTNNSIRNTASFEIDSLEEKGQWN